MRQMFSKAMLAGVFLLALIQTSTTGAYAQTSNPYQLKQVYFETVTLSNGNSNYFVWFITGNAPYNYTSWDVEVRTLGGSLVTKVIRSGSPFYPSVPLQFESPSKTDYLMSIVPTGNTPLFEWKVRTADTSLIPPNNANAQFAVRGGTDNSNGGLTGNRPCITIGTANYNGLSSQYWSIFVRQKNVSGAPISSKVVQSVSNFASATFFGLTPDSEYEFSVLPDTAAAYASGIPSVSPNFIYSFFSLHS
jgi:hypothetical protein